MKTTDPSSLAVSQKGFSEGSSSTPPLPFGWVPIIAPLKPAACASRSTSAARAPSCRGTVASGTKRGSRIAVCAKCVLISRDQAAPLLRRHLIGEHVEPAADHLALD